MGNDPWLTVGIALIAAVAALSGALIAAVTAGRRQRTQLRHDAERQQNELQHDRALAELSELRGVLDEASRDITTAEREMFDATHAWIYEGGVSDALREAMAESFVAMWGSALVEADAADRDKLARIKDIDDPRSSFLRQRDAFYEAAQERYGSKGLRRD
jgi:hypothetical protein